MNCRQLNKGDPICKRKKRNVVIGLGKKGREREDWNLSGLHES